MNFKEWLILESVNVPMLTQQYKKLFPNATEQEIQQKINLAANADPTPQKKYTPWIFKEFLARHIRLPEDNTIIQQMLNTFHQKKAQIKKLGKDIDITNYNRYTLSKLVDEIEDQELKSKRQIDIETKTKGAQKIYEDNNWILIKLTTPGACTIYTKGTKWCTSDPIVSQEYLHQGPLYQIFYNKKPYAQIHFATGQFMDPHDEPVKPNPETTKLIQMIPTNTDIENIGKAKIIGDNETKAKYIMSFIKNNNANKLEDLLQTYELYKFGNIINNLVILQRTNNSNLSVTGIEDSIDPFLDLHPAMEEIINKLRITDDAKEELKTSIEDEDSGLYRTIHDMMIGEIVAGIFQQTKDFARTANNKGVFARMEINGRITFFMPLENFEEELKKGYEGPQFKDMVNSTTQDINHLILDLIRNIPKNIKQYINPNKYKDAFLDVFDY